MISTLPLRSTERRDEMWYSTPARPSPPISLSVNSEMSSTRLVPGTGMGCGSAPSTESRVTLISENTTAACRYGVNFQSFSRYASTRMPARNRLVSTWPTTVPDRPSGRTCWSRMRVT